MKNLEYLVSVVLSKFESYINNTSTLTFLILSLMNIENQLKRKRKLTNKELWFKFFNDDTGATTIYDLQRDLNNPTNRDYTIENIKHAIENKSLQVYFS